MIKTPFTKEAKTSKEEKVTETISDEKDNKLAKYVGEGDIAKLKWWDDIKLGSEVSRATRTQLAEVAQKMVEKQKQEITHRLMLDLDVNKKRAYQQYLDNVGILNNDLVKRSTEMEGELHDILVDSIEGIYKKKDEWIARINALKLSDEDHKEEIDRMNKWIDIAKQQVDGKVELLIETHSQSIAATLQLLKNTVPDGEG